MVATTKKANSEVVLLPIASIGIPKGHRSVNRGKVRQMAESIEAEGLLQAIGVRDDPNRPGHYLLIFGRHRLEATRSLGRDEIEARVLGLDDEDAAMAMLSENLWRNPLKRSEYLEALADWNRRYTAKYPEVHGKRAGAEAKKRKQRALGAGADPAPAHGDGPTKESLSTVEGPSMPAEPEPPPTFSEMAADQLGVSQRVIQKDLRISRALGIEDLRTLEERGLGKTEIERVATIADPAKRHRAVELIASGLEPSAARALATAPANATIETVVVADAPDYKPESEMTDEEWLDVYCGGLLSRLPHQETFRRDAVLWRRTRESRRELRRNMRALLAEMGPRPSGPLQNATRRLADLAHPNDWLVCGPCGGTGTIGADSCCSSCWGHGYRIKEGG